MENTFTSTAQFNQLLTLLDGLPCLAWIATADGSIQAYNHYAAEYNILPGTPNGHWLGLVHDSEKDGCSAGWQRALEGGSVFSGEYRFKMADGHYRWHRTEARLHRDAQGLPLHWVGTAADIHHQKETVAPPPQHNALLQTLLAVSPDCVQLLDRDGRLLHINENGLCQMELDDLSQVAGIYWWELWQAENRPQIKEAAAAALAGNTTRISLCNTTPKGNEIWWEITVSPVQDEGGAVIQLLAISRNITDQIKNADRLQRLGRHLQLATTAANAGTWDVNLQTQQLEWSDLHKELWGYSADFDGVNPAVWEAAILPEDLQRVTAHFAIAEKVHLPVDISYRIKRANDGSVHWVRSIGRYTYNEAGVATNLSGICLDITAQKAAEEAAKASEEKYRAVFDSIDQGLSIMEMIFDEEGNPVDYRFLECNPMFSNQTGLIDAEGKTAREMVPNLEEHWFQLYGNVARTGQPLRFVNGSDAMGRWFDVYAFKMGGTNSNRVAVLFKDITEQRKVETTLRRLTAEQSETVATLESLLKNAPVGFAFFDLEHRYLRVNETLAEINRLSIEAHLGKRMDEVLPQTAADLAPVINQVIATRKPVLNFELESDLFDPNGKRRYWLTSFYPVLNGPDNTVTSVGAVVIEITDRKHAEEKIRESEERFRNIFNTAATAILVEDFSQVKEAVDQLKAAGVTDLKDYLEKHPKQTERLIGLKSLKDVNDFSLHVFQADAKEDLINGWGNIFAPETLEVYRRELQAIAEGQHYFEAETEVRDLRGERRHIFLSIYFPVGTDYSTVLASITDITERKKAEQAVQESESRFRILAETLPQMVWTMDAAGNMEFASKAWHLYSGIEDVRHAWRNMIHPDDLEPVMGMWEAHFATGISFRQELRLRSKEGEYRWHYSVAEALRNEQGEVLRWIGAMTDIHEQKTFAAKLGKEVAERTGELQKLTRQLKSLNSYLLLQNQTFTHAEEVSGQGSYSWNLKTGTINYSDNLYRLLGYEPGSFEPSEESFFSFVHPEDRKWLQPRRPGIAGGDAEAVRNYRILLRDGTVRHIRSTGRIIIADGEDVLIGTLQDVTEDVLLRQKLQANNLELERSNADLQQFAHVASHDLKEPVRKIRFFSSCITSEFGEMLPPKAIQYVHKIENAAGRMYSMVEGVLQYSALNEDTTDTEPVQLEQLLSSIETDLELVIREKGAQIKYQGLPALRGYPVLLHQLFYNLINNALKFAKAGVPPEIVISASGNQVVDGIAMAAITISDNGIGFEPEHAEQIFKTFARLNPKDEFEGTGLGLALCKKIAERHGGTISATAQKGAGAVFTVVLPVEG